MLIRNGLRIIILTLLLMNYLNIAKINDLEKEKLEEEILIVETQTENTINEETSEQNIATSEEVEQENIISNEEKIKLEEIIQGNIINNEYIAQETITSIEEILAQSKVISDIQETNEVLINPGKGFTLQNKSTNKYDDIVAIGYDRYDWADIEPEEGVYNWELIDNNINYYKQKGKQYAFGVMCANTSREGQYVTPKWVFDAGAEGREVEVTFWLNNTKQIQTIPVWNDTIFLQKLNNFIKALAKRYDGNKSIAFIDMRSYGNWGEQHNGEIGGEELTANELKELYIKPYINNFKNTLLVNPWGREKYNEVYKWAIQNGVSIRRDGIFQYSDGTECLMAYGKLPSIFEYTGNYKWMKNNGYWNKETLLKYIENGKPSYIQFDSDMYKENKEFCEMIANKIGYYFKLRKVEYNSIQMKGISSQIKLNFINEGVAPLYENCQVYIGLLDENDNLIKKYKTNINAHSWMPNQEKQETINIQFDEVESGKYKIAVGLYYNSSDEHPTYLLGNEGKTKDKWYTFGEIFIVNET